MSECEKQQTAQVGQPDRSPAPPLSDEAVESIAAWLRVLSEPTRIRLMEILNSGSGSVQGLAAQLSTTHQNVSKHLNVLHQAGIVSRRKVKNRVEYQLIDWSGWWMVEQAGVSVTAESDDPKPMLRNCAIA